jgi:hypothetical protein
VPLIVSDLPVLKSMGLQDRSGLLGIYRIYSQLLFSINVKKFSGGLDEQEADRFEVEDDDNEEFIHEDIINFKKPLKFLCINYHYSSI